MAFGIPTTSSGVNFRSRLEARWAEMFSLLGWRWTYEPFDLDGYIPDFLLDLDKPVLVEVKPGASLDELSSYEPPLNRKIRGWEHEALLVGVAPFRCWDGGDPSFGLLLERFGKCEACVEHQLPDEKRCLGAWDSAIAMRCTKCEAISFRHRAWSWRSRACGHYDGDGYLGEVTLADLDRLWREAGNRVQWRRAA